MNCQVFLQYQPGARTKDFATLAFGVPYGLRAFRNGRSGRHDHLDANDSGARVPCVQCGTEFCIWGSVCGFVIHLS